MNELTKIWLAGVVALSCTASFGMIEPDPFRAFAPKNTALYVSWKDGGERHARAYLKDGSIAELTDGEGVTVSSLGEVPNTHIDPLPQATPWERLRMRMSSAYGVTTFGKHAELVTGMRSGGRTILKGSELTARGLEISHLPSTLLLWSTDEEPVATMKSTDREPMAIGEGRYGRVDAPSVVILAQVPHADDFLKLLTAFEDPKSRPFPLGDDSSAKEIIASTDSIEITPTHSAIGEIRKSDSTHPVPALIALTDDAPKGIKALIMSDSSVAEEPSTLMLPNCPIEMLTSFVKAPFFALGASRDGTFVFCSE